MVVERPFLHVTDAVRADPVDDQRGVVDGSEVLAEERVIGPDLLENGTVGDDLRDPGDPDLVVLVVEVDQLDPGIGRDLDGLVVTPQVGDVDREAVGLDRGDRRTRGWSPSIVARFGNRACFITSSARSLSWSGSRAAGIGFVIGLAPVGHLTGAQGTVAEMSDGGGPDARLGRAVVAAAGSARNRSSWSGAAARRWACRSNHAPAAGRSPATSASVSPLPRSGCSS